MTLQRPPRDSGAINLVKISVIAGVVAVLYFGYIYGPSQVNHIGVKKAVRVAANSAYTVRSEKSVKDTLIKEFKELDLKDEKLHDDGTVTVEPATINEENITVELVQMPPQVTVSVNYNRSVVWPFLKKEKTIPFTYSHTESLAPTKW
jgi:hypothetical protein